MRDSMCARMSVSVALDSVYKLLTEGKLKKRERLVEFLDSLTEQADRLLNIWFDIRAAIGKLPKDRWSKEKVDEYRELVGNYAFRQSYFEDFFRSLYDSISAASARLLNEEELKTLSNATAHVILLRASLRKVYDLVRQDSSSFLDEDQLSSLDADIAKFSLATAKLRASVAVLKAK
jgi:hypothetical protein